jgi:hypothetical protein
MRAPWIVLLAAACGLGAGVMWRIESTRAAALAREVAKLKADNAKLSGAAGATELPGAIEAGSLQLRAAPALSDPRIEPAATAPQEEAKPRSGSGLLAKMFENPEMKKMLAAQQEAALRGLYGDYAKQAGLTPAEAERFFQLLEARQMALMDSSANMISGEAVDMKAATAAANATDQALKDLLGPERFGQYQDFEKALAERVQVRQFNQQLAADGEPLDGSQSKALIRIMSEERESLPSFNPGNAGDAQQAATDVERYSRQVDAMNQRVYNRAASVLTPQQLSAFAVFQKNMAAAQTASLKVTQEMLRNR